MKAIIVDEPWISRILTGEKTWEMRKGSCHKHEVIGLIRKGSGLVVATACIGGSLSAIATLEAFAAAEPYHRIEPSRQERAFQDGWRTPWLISDVKLLAEPIPYAHPSGAVIWVDIGSLLQSFEDLGNDKQPLAQELEKVPTMLELNTSEKFAITNIEPQLFVTQSSKKKTILIKLTGGNIRNHHFYLPLDQFHDSVIGGRNKMERASRNIEVQFDFGETVRTDIDASKRIFRCRGAIRDFFNKSKCQEGDNIIVTLHNEYVCSVGRI